MAGPTYDDSQWPIYRIVLPGEALTWEEFTGYLKHIDALFLRGERFAFVLDARKAPILDARERREIAKHMKRSYERYPRRLAAMAIVLSSPLQRGIFTAINWISGPSHPSRAFASMQEAEAWLRQMLVASVSGMRVSVPPPT